MVMAVPVWGYCAEPGCHEQVVVGHLPDCRDIDPTHATPFSQGLELKYCRLHQPQQKPTVSKEEKVNHPAHYGGDTPYEVIKVLRAWGLDKNFCLANTIKYIARAGKKDESTHMQDLEKAAWYLVDEINAMAGYKRIVTTTNEKPAPKAVPVTAFPTDAG